MATQELRELRHEYKEAYTAYMQCVQIISDASQRGVWLSEENLHAEQKAFGDLSRTREALLYGLFEHSRNMASGQDSG